MPNSCPSHATYSITFLSYAYVQHTSNACPRGHNASTLRGGEGKTCVACVRIVFLSFSCFLPAFLANIPPQKWEVPCWMLSLSRRCVPDRASLYPAIKQGSLGVFSLLNLAKRPSVSLNAQLLAHAAVQNTPTCPLSSVQGDPTKKKYVTMQKKSPPTKYHRQESDDYKRE